jgi:hypothetical protein
MNPTQSGLAIAALISIALGIVQCFFGYRFFKFVVGLTGFVACGFLVGSIAYGISENEIVGVVVGLIGGLLGAWLFVALYFLGVFLVGAFLGVVLSLMAFAAAGTEPHLVLVTIAAIVAGVLAVWIQKFMIMLSTAFGGSWIIVQGIAFFVSGAANWGFWPSAGHAAVTLIGWLVLGAIGLIVQWNAEHKQEVRVARSA